MATTTRVGMVLYDGCTLLDFAGATQVFAFAPGRSLWENAGARPPRPCSD